MKTKKIETLTDKLKNAGRKVNEAITSPRGVLTLLTLAPILYMGIKWAYALITGDHAHMQDVGHIYCSAQGVEGLDTNHDGVIADGEYKIYGDVAHNPHLAQYDTNHDGVLSNIEMYNQEEHVVPGLNYDNFQAQPNDLETIAKFDADSDGKWNFDEFKAYLAKEHPEAANRPERDWLPYQQKELGGKWIPFRAD